MIDGATLKVNSKLNEFTIQQILGAGTFGVTYLAYDNYLDKQVVIKEYFPNDIAIRADSSTVFSKSDHDKESFEYGLDSFMKEAKTIAKFDHPNVVKINSFFEANNTAYFVMDYYKGQDLEVYLQQNPQLSEEQILDIIIPLLDGLREVHGKSYLHRDIKPGNIYLKSNGNPMLIDFGATRYSIGAKSQSLSVILTPGYAPKEQYSSRSKQDACTDIYAIGAVLYKIVTGASPIEASERSDIITNDEPDPHIGLMDMNYPNYSEHFKRAIDWALAFKPKDRPQSVRELQNALEGKDKPEVESEIEPQKTETTQKEAKIHKKQKSRLLPILGGVGVTIAVGVIAINYYNDTITDKGSYVIVEDNSTSLIHDTQKEFGESIDRGSYIKPALVKIKAGSFTMGSDSGYSDEKPTHKVTIDYDFAIGKYEVTNQEFVKFLNDVSTVESEWVGTKSQDEDSHIIKSSSSYSVENGYEKHPVIEVTWFGAKAYAKWLSQKTGKTYRLPTEAEWEFAVRAETTSKWSFGDSKSNLKKYAWYDENSYGLGADHKDYGTHQIGTKEANPWGVYDMHGNVWEWCEDWYVNSYNNTPKDGSANTQGKKEYRVLRGGSWINVPSGTRSAFRNGFNPTNRDYIIGFRLQRTLP